MLTARKIRVPTARIVRWLKIICMKIALHAALLLTLVPATARAQINAGEQKPESDLPFTMTQVATFKLPWRLAFLPDGRMLITEKVGPVWLVTQQGEQTPGEHDPAVLYLSQTRTLTA